MPKTPSNKQRTKVKDLSKESKKLKTGDMKKVKGGGVTGGGTTQGISGLPAVQAPGSFLSLDVETKKLKAQG